MFWKNRGITAYCKEKKNKLPDNKGKNSLEKQDFITLTYLPYGQITTAFSLVDVSGTNIH